MENYERFYHGKRILITGGAGSIGTNLSRALSRLGANLVVILDNMSAAYSWNVPSMENILFVKGSINNEVDLKRVFSLKPDIVFHLAAFFANQNSIDYPQHDLQTNGKGTLLVFQYSQMTEVKKLIYASSGCSIYGSEAALPLSENFMSMYLTSPYQITKMLGELYANFFYHQYHLPIVKTRLFNSYGPGEVPGQYRNVIPNFIFYALSGLPLPFTGHDDTTRDFTYVGDIVDAFLRAGYFQEAVGKEMNIASGSETRILDMAEQINRLTGNQAGVIKAPKRAWDTKNRLLADIQRAKSLLGYEPKTSFETGLTNTIQWFRTHWDHIRRDADFPPGTSAAVQGSVARKELKP